MCVPIGAIHELATCHLPEGDDGILRRLKQSLKPQSWAFYGIVTSEHSELRNDYLVAKVDNKTDFEIKSALWATSVNTWYSI